MHQEHLAGGIWVALESLAIVLCISTTTVTRIRDGTTGTDVVALSVWVVTSATRAVIPIMQALSLFIKVKMVVSQTILLKIALDIGIIYTNSPII